MHKRLAHISCERQDLPEKWYLQAFAEEIERAYALFHKSLATQPSRQALFTETLQTFAKGEVFCVGVLHNVGPARDTTSPRTRLT